MSKQVGRVFGKLTVLSVALSTSKGGFPVQKATVSCACGYTYVTHVSNLLGGKVTQCKTCRAQQYVEASAQGYRHPLHAKWWSMLSRCYYRTAEMFSYYGARGITVCDRWRGNRKDSQEIASIDGFHNFVEDMGLPPTKRHSLDRIDVNGNYEPRNCRWATPEEQLANMREPVAVPTVTLKGVTLMYSEWARKLGARLGTVRRLMAEGETPTVAVVAAFLRTKVPANAKGKRVLYAQLTVKARKLVSDYEKLA